MFACAPAGPNSSLDEQGPSYVEAGDQPLLYFSSGSATVPGDIYVSEGLADGSFGPAAADLSSSLSAFFARGAGSLPAANAPFGRGAENVRSTSHF